MGELSARKATPRRAERIDQGCELGGQAPEPIEVEHDHPDTSGNLVRRSRM